MRRSLTCALCAFFATLSPVFSPAEAQIAQGTTQLSYSDKPSLANKLYYEGPPCSPTNFRVAIFQNSTPPQALLAD